MTDALRGDSNKYIHRIAAEFGLLERHMTRFISSMCRIMRFTDRQKSGTVLVDFFPALKAPGRR